MIRPEFDGQHFAVLINDSVILVKYDEEHTKRSQFIDTAYCRVIGKSLLGSDRLGIGFEKLIRPENLKVLYYRNAHRNIVTGQLMGDLFFGYIERVMTTTSTYFIIKHEVGMGWTEVLAEGYGEWWWFSTDFIKQLGLGENPST